MGAKYVSGSVRGAGSVEERRLFSFTRSSICCSPAPTLFTDSCHYLRLIRFYPICRTTLFTETRTTRALNGGSITARLVIAVSDSALARKRMRRRRVAIKHNENDKDRCFSKGRNDKHQDRYKHTPETKWSNLHILNIGDYTIKIHTELSAA